ncbi:ATP-binding protein [Anaerosinus massiliensis]|uniref:ATP-binding protein n=1 Tax=Massilibacillus massiliensis TaxID=1806837 RepID=UPI000A8A0CD1|nr:ATP-binding protein [Massilibacillus massiliensis]
MPFQEEQINLIIHEARAHSTELPWGEFKVNKCTQPQEIGEYISALSNTAALYNKDKALMIWGIDDETHELVGTEFDPSKVKQGNQGLELWISTQLDPQVQFYFHKTELEEKKIILLEISSAASAPVKFKNIDYIRIDSHKKKLKDYVDTERELWAILAKKSFEIMTAMEDVPGDFVIRLLDYPAYFDLLSQELPSDKVGILNALLADGLIAKCVTGNYNITNLGAILFAKKLSDFPSLERKAIRVIQYKDNSRIHSVKEQIGHKGYATGFDGLIEYINGILPRNEIMGRALRKDIPMYPELAVREVVANAIIHQNFFLQGTSPMIEIFEDRMEVTNPGTPLIETKRFIDSPPISRNEKLASFMRRIGVCEERGSGFDKIVHQTEYYQLPAPEIEVYHNNTRVTMFAHKDFSKMSKEDKMRACYLHACLKRVNREYMTNSSLRERFKVAAKNSAVISRLLNDSCEAGLVKITDDTVTANKNRRYVPYWG